MLRLPENQEIPNDYDYDDTIPGNFGDLIPPCTNRGGNTTSPGESSLTALDKAKPPYPKIAAIIDYLTFTGDLGETIRRDKVKRVVKRPLPASGKLQQVEYDEVDTDYDGDDVILLRDEKTEADTVMAGIVEKVCDMVEGLKWLENKHGQFGYSRTVGLYRDGQHAGIVAWGGNSNTFMVSLSGTGTAGIKSLGAMRNWIEQTPGGKITRVDAANDDLEGVRPIAFWVEQYEQREFYNGGRPPKARLMDDFGSGAGKTLYVGRLSNGMEACIYEKGKQKGDEKSPWVRVEGRFSNADRVIPTDILTSPEMYLAGMYPAFRYLCAFHERIAVFRETMKIGYTLAKHYARLQVGKLINVMVEMGDSPEQIISELRRDGVPSRLLVPVPV